MYQVPTMSQDPFSLAFRGQVYNSGPQVVHRLPEKMNKQTGLCQVPRGSAQATRRQGRGLPQTRREKSSQGSEHLTPNFKGGKELSRPKKKRRGGREFQAKGRESAFGDIESEAGVVRP